MDCFQDLLSCVGATVFFSLLLSFVANKYFKMDSASDQTTSPATSLTKQKVIASRQSKTKGQSFIFDRICEEQSFYSNDNVHDDESTVSVVESPLRHVSSDGVLLDEFTNVEMKTEAYDFVELLNPEEIKLGGDDFLVDKVFDESPGSLESGKDEFNSSNWMDLDWEEGGGIGKEKYDEDWEGIERSELEKLFGEAMIFVGSMNNASNIANLDDDDKLQLYALGIIVLEGPYILPQPIGLKVSSRVKWNAVRKLRHLNREMAMDRYISLLTNNFPDWSSRKNIQQMLVGEGS